MAIVNGWFDWAEQQPGPANKVWPETNAIAGVVFHSAVGSLQGVIDRVQGPDEVSVTAVVGFDGRFVQFYPVTASPWANGSHDTNKAYLGFEFEGGYDGPDENGVVHWITEPIYQAQVDAAIHILKDLAAYKAVPESFWQRPATLIEHHEIFPTACPSGRIPWDVITAGLVPSPLVPGLIDGIGLHFEGGFTQQIWPTMGPVVKE